MKEFIEIPFGAKDSELCGWEYIIPKGFVASIENGKIVVKKEESKDEKIRMALIHYFSHPENTSFEYWEAIPKSEAIAWLEKQGEQNLTDKVESKFKEGDWVVYEITGSVYQIKDCIENPYNHKYGYLTNDGYISEVNHYHLWTIQDAKDGDVLAEDSCIFILKEMRNDSHAITYCTLFDDGEFHDGETLYFDVGSTNPATKEQSELLFQKMKEAGYEWDADKKKLRKVEQKPAWSEDDEIELDNIIDFLNSPSTAELCPTFCGYAVDWLKSLKDRVQPQWKPSEEQIEVLNMVITDEAMDDNVKTILKELIIQLKKL